MTKTAVVTGAAGGVGRAVTARLAEQGYAVVAEDIDEAVMDLAVPGRIVPLRGDVADTATAQRAVELAMTEFGRLDLLVNNAAVFILKPTSETTDDDWDRGLATNVRGVFVHARAALPRLAEASGAIVNVASVSGLVGAPGQTVYAAAKGAIVQLTRQLAVEHAASGVRVNAVAPGIIDTGFFAHVLADSPDPEAHLTAIVAEHPLGRMSTPEEVAHAIAFLGSAEASAITGAILPVDGGFSAR
ncbi:MULTISPECIES: SDR family NAD(P)-dependent oxidoreductase [unclassified Modestobacter]